MQFCLTSTFIACFVIQASLLLQLTTAHGSKCNTVFLPKDYTFVLGNAIEVTY